MSSDDKGRPVRLPWGPSKAQEPPTPLHTLTLAEVMSPPDAPQAMSDSWARYVKDGWRGLDWAVDRLSLRERSTPSGVPGYRIAYDEPCRTIAVIEEGSGAPAGGLLEGNLHVLAAHQGKGIAAAVMELAFEVGIKRIGHNVALSTGGRATRRAAHRLSVRHAIAGGVPIRDEVLADYPDLRASAIVSGSLAQPDPDDVPAEDGDAAPPGLGR